MPQTREVALDHYAQRQAFVNATAEVATQMWADVNPRDIVNSWAQQVPELTAVVSGAQLGAARQADPYTTDALQTEGADPASVSPVDPAGFSGHASDGRGLMSLLTHPVVVTLMAIQDGMDVLRAMGFGRTNLEMVTRTQVADAGRLADQTALTARPAATGYVRVAVGNSCARCLILAGKFYRWSQGFRRHPMCDCIHVPRSDPRLARLMRDPRDIYADMTRAERLRAGFTLADQQALRMGADLEQIVNARHRPDALFTAGGRRLTREGSTKRGFAGRRLRGDDRLTPDQIFAEAGTRAEAQQMLFDNGYLLTAPRPATGSVSVLPDDLGQALRSSGRGAMGVLPDFPVAAAVDPAMSMTVADIKAAARAAGAPIIGTRKADILANLRVWETGNARRIPGLPEWKPPAVRPLPPITAPPLGKPDPNGPVLTGASLNDWADYFRYDFEQRRFQLLSVTGDTPANGIRVHDLRVRPGAFDGSYPAYVVQTATAWRIDGVSYLIEHGPDDFGAPWVSRALHELRQAHASIAGAAGANKSYAWLAHGNPADVYWRQRYRSNHVSAASAGGGHVSLWNHTPVRRLSMDDLRHETGHNVDEALGRFQHGSESDRWMFAAEDDVVVAQGISDLQATAPRVIGLGQVDPARRWPNGVTDYGRSSAVEDWAESVLLYQLGPIATGRLPGFVPRELPGVSLPPGMRAITAEETLYFRDIFPNRARILDEVFPDLAAAQRAEIAALRAPAQPAEDLARLRVAELRALAVERGIVVPPGARKADLVELLGGSKPATRVTAAERAERARQAAAERAARTRQAAVDKVRSVADLLSEVDQLISDGASARALRHRIQTRAKVAGTPPAVVKSLLDAADDPAALRVAMEKAARGARLTPSTAVAGEVATFDRKLMEGIGGDIPSGRTVRIVRPGYTATVRGERVTVSRAVVEELDVAEVKRIQQAAQRAAARERQRVIAQADGSAKLLAEVDELLSKKATAATIRQRLDPKLIEPEQLFANADRAVLDALRTALDSGDMAKVRATVTRLTTKAKLKATSKAGAKVKFDSDAMEPVGGVEIPKGAQVVVVTRGSSVVIDGETVVLTKPQVALAGPSQGSPGAVPAAVAKRNPGMTEGQRKLYDLSTQPVTSTRAAGEGYHARTEIETTTRGQFVRKTFERRDVRNLRESADAEELATVVARALGIETPDVVRVADNELLMSFVDNAVGGVDIVTSIGTIPVDIVDSAEGRLMGLFDLLINNNDRNAGGWFRRSDGSLVAIDHGYAWTRGQVPKMMVRFNEYFSRYLRPTMENEGTNGLSRSAMVALRARLLALRHEFARLAREDWHREMMESMDQVVKWAQD